MSRTYISGLDGEDFAAFEVLAYDLLESLCRYLNDGLHPEFKEKGREFGLSFMVGPEKPDGKLVLICWVSGISPADKVEELILKDKESHPPKTYALRVSFSYRHGIGLEQWVEALAYRTAQNLLSDFSCLVNFRTIKIGANSVAAWRWDLSPRK